MSGGDADNEATLADVEDAVRALQVELAALREQSAALTVQSTAARRDVVDYGRRHSGLVQQRKVIGDRRRDAGDKVGRITKMQLSEIKHLARNPPDAIRRTLIAAWILLHSQRFKGKFDVVFDEAKDWPRCQRMLADEHFIPHILNFDTTALCETPHVLWHVAWHFFGIGEKGSSASDEQPCRRANDRDGEMSIALLSHENRGSDRTTVFTPQSPAALNRVVQPGSQPAMTWKDDSPMRRCGSAVALGRASLGNGTNLRRRKTELARKPPLDVDMVSHASQPCGALLLWMLELVREYGEEEKLRRQLHSIEKTLQEAEARLRRLESELEKVEAATKEKQELAIEQERVLQHLQNELAKHDGVTTKGAAAPKPAAKRRPPSPEMRTTADSFKVAVELCGSMAHVERELSKLKVPFDKGEAKAGSTNQDEQMFLTPRPWVSGWVNEVLCGNAEQAVVLPKLAELIKKGRGSLKVLIEGHCQSGEKDGSDMERCLAVYEWLVQAAAVPPGLLRIKGCGQSQGIGRYAIPVPIHELAPSSGPLPAEIQAASAKAPPGIYFQASSATLGLEIKSIVNAMAKFLCDDDDVLVRIEGHTDRDEREGLGMERAMSVIEVLIGSGVKSSRLKPMNCKHLHPLDRIHGCMNRRVELHAL